MFKSCPISTRRIDSNLVRFISAQVSLITTLLIITKLPIFAIILLFDFTMRALRKPSFSPFILIGKFGVHMLQLQPKMCDEAPKRFALFIGFSFSFVLSILYIGNYNEAATIVASVLLVCALLETIFDYCLGCKLYQIIKIFKKLL